MRRDLLVLFIFLQILVTIRANVPAIIVFGDSTVDSGNNNHISTILRSDFKPYGRDFYGGKSTGRFSNGRIATDFISEAFGLKPTVPAYMDPKYNITDFATGVCFASAGSGYDNATSDVLVSLSNISLQQCCCTLICRIIINVYVHYYMKYLFAM